MFLDSFSIVFDYSHWIIYVKVYIKLWFKGLRAWKKIPGFFIMLQLQFAKLFDFEFICAYIIYVTIKLSKQEWQFMQNILIAEPEKIIDLDLRKQLKHFNLVSIKPDSILSLLEVKSFDLLIIDTDDKNLSLLSSIKKNFHLPIILLSSMRQKESQKFVDIVDAIIEEPYQSDELRNAINNIFSSAISNQK